MKQVQEKQSAGGVSRQTATSGAAGIVAADPAVPVAMDTPDINWQLECRYTTGGAPYRPDFAAMFFDPMFLAIQVGPSDLGPTANMSIPPRVGGGHSHYVSRIGILNATTPGTPVPPFGPDTLRMPDPPDMPIIPSGGTGRGIGSLTKYSVSVVLINDQTNWADSSRQAIQKAYDANQELLGVVVFHNALGDNQNWPLWYKELAGGLLVLEDQEGLKKTTITPGASYDVRAVGNHAIVQDIASFRVTGEDAYKGVWHAPRIEPLLEATGPSTDQVVAWVGPNPEKARVVVISPGTSPETFRNREFRRFVRNSILWAGHRLD